MVWKVKLEYGCFPIWRYDDSGDLIDNNLPNDPQFTEITADLMHLQTQFNDKFTNNSREFCYNGFSSENERNEFIDKITRIAELLEQMTGIPCVIEAHI